jgi:hypothetical protein
MTAAGKTEILAYRLADDRPAGIENTRHHRRIDIRHIAFHRRGAVHHRHAGEANFVFERDLLALQRAGVRAFDLGHDVPVTVRVVLA